MSNIITDGLSMDELVALRDDINLAIKQFLPYRIKERYVTCSVAGCWCSKSGEKHGPYLYVSFRKGGKMKTRSLGLKAEPWEFEEWEIRYPEIQDYIRIKPPQYEKLSVLEAKNLVEYKLTALQYEKRYGLKKSEDTFGRYDRFYGTQEDYDAYDLDWSLALQMDEIPYSPWRSYGVSTLSGIAILARLESQQYYLKK